MPAVDHQGSAAVLDPSSPGAAVAFTKSRTRYYGVEILNSAKIAMDCTSVADEVLANLRAVDGTALTVRLEIGPTHSDGFRDREVRTVSKNAMTLKFDQFGFEEN